ncbi:unnamed protein product [Phaedon cochleariae]|uniref:Uncharacterized protein n=1 Tax=Phaedon cochleariae TaxID=80249 RepID=A0A9N9SK92_PHACE|nr:unnamed protein product [Phaedon cochleariae]
METEKLDSEEPKKNPDLDISQLKFSLTLQETDEEKKELEKALFDNDMAPYYEIVCDDLGWKVDADILKEMKEKNTKALEEFDKEIEYAASNSSSIEVKEAYLNKANYLR